PDPVRRVGGDLARHERPVAVGVVSPGAADEALAAGDAADELRMPVVDPGVDDRNPDRRERRHRRPVVPRLVRRQVPLLGGERLAVRERRRRHRDRGHGDERERAPHGTSSAGEKPGERPRPGAIRTRYEPGESGAGIVNEPAVSVVAVATVVQPTPSRSWSCTAEPARAGCTVPATAPVPSVACTTGTTAALTSPAWSVPAVSRYCVVTCGVTVVVNAPLPSGTTDASVCQSPPAGLASSVTEPTPRATPLSVTVPPKATGAVGGSSASQPTLNQLERSPRSARSASPVSATCEPDPIAVTVATRPEGPGVACRSTSDWPARP